MVRLLQILDSLSEKSENLQAVFDGKYVIPRRTPANPTDKDETEYDPTYWLDDGCFLQITESCPEQPMLANVVMGIPAEKLGIYYDLRNEVDNLKRLKNILLGMRENTEKFDGIYNGDCKIVSTDGSFPPELVSDPIYWREGVFYHITQTGRLKLSCPTVTVGVPTEALGICCGAENIAVADFCLRALKPYMDELNSELFNRSRPVEENGWYYFCEPSGEILLRNSAYFSARMPRDYDYGSGVTVYLCVGKEIKEVMYLCLMIQVQLPYHRMKKTVRMLTSDLPKMMDRYIRNFDRAALLKVIDLADKQRAIREYLKNSEYCAFIANGSILPRKNDTDLPMENAVPFISPKDDEVEIAGVRGMAIKRGVTVITGGGYSGKTTLVEAIAAGIYDHALGDGRELCITDPSAVSVSAEDGRAISHVNISSFLSAIPSSDPRDFSTSCASGSTSQAASIAESVSRGARLLLIDEDRSATNFMIRDPLMRKLIKNEPLIPFTERVRELSARGVSTVLVIGGSGEYLKVADKIYMMENFQPVDVTAYAKGLSNNSPEKEKAPSADWSQGKIYRCGGFDSHPNGFGREVLRVFDLGVMIIGAEELDLRGLHNVVSPRQLHGIGFILRAIMAKNAQDSFSNPEKELDVEREVDEIYRKIEAEGLDCVYSGSFADMKRFIDLPRREEVMQAVSRLRTLVCERWEVGDKGVC